MKTRKILLAGATGYLGRCIASELQHQNYPTRLIVRHKHKNRFDASYFETIIVEVTKPQTLEHTMQGIDTAISAVGITKQKDGLTYLDVDYQPEHSPLPKPLARWRFSSRFWPWMW